MVGLNFDFLRATYAEIQTLFDLGIALQRIENPTPITIATGNIVFDDRYFVKDAKGNLYLNLKYITAMNDQIVKLFNPDLVVKMNSFEEDHTVMSIMKLNFAGDHFIEKNKIIS